MAALALTRLLQFLYRSSSNFFTNITTRNRDIMDSSRAKNTAITTHTKRRMPSSSINSSCSNRSTARYST